MGVQSGLPSDRQVVLFDYATSRAQEVPVRLLDDYRGYVMTDDYVGYKALAAQDGVERLGGGAHVRRKFVDAQKVQPKGKTGRADIALNLINKLYGVERDGRRLRLLGDWPPYQPGCESVGGLGCSGRANPWLTDCSRLSQMAPIGAIFVIAAQRSSQRGVRHSSDCSWLWKGVW